MSGRNVKHLAAGIGLLSLLPTTTNAVMVQIDGHPTMEQIDVQRQRPSWDSIPDISFRCQNENYSVNDEIKLVVSHKDREIYINGKPFSKITEFVPVYNVQKNEFGNYEVMIYISLVRGPGWEFAAFQPHMLFVLLPKNVFYKCI